MTNLLMFQQATLNFVHSLQSFSTWKWEASLSLLFSSPHHHCSYFQCSHKKSGQNETVPMGGTQTVSKIRVLGQCPWVWEENILVLDKWNRKTESSLPGITPGCNVTYESQASNPTQSPDFQSTFKSAPGSQAHMNSCK